MKYRIAPWAAVAALTLTVMLIPAPAAGQALATAKAGKVWTPPRTTDGVPDLQGVWTNNTVTPLQRPKGLGSKEFYTDAELQALQSKEKDRLAKNEEEGLPTEPGTAADVHYDFSEYGLDRGQSKMVWNHRTSIIVGPEGTIPPLTPEARQRLAEKRAKAKGHEFDGPESRPLGARCLVRENNGPPLLPTAYNSNLQIVQGPGYVVIESEEIHDARIIPTDGRPHIAKDVRQWMGDSVGRWEGNTLVVDTTNFTDQNPFDGAQNLHVTERFTRVDDETILYQFTVEDPGMWTKPWSGELPITRIQGQLYEYACNEANYGLANTLRGARVAEEEAAKKAAGK
ncbi:MAG TPA: hypothetical protein VKT49_00615 [Bryobacteraceae bacterium]|nr:hypothetical protein [Bryobacteraceae bacterium]